MSTYILAFPVDGDMERRAYISGEKGVECFHGLRYIDYDDLKSDIGNHTFKFYSVKDFVDLCNDEYFSVDNYWITYVEIG